MTEATTKGPIVFYCKDCEKIVDTHRIGKKYLYKCAVCGTKNVAFGTEKSIRSFFRIKEEEPVLVEEVAKKEAKEIVKEAVEEPIEAKPE